MKEQFLKAIYSIARRADTVDAESLQKSFVSVGGIGLRIGSPDHQVIFGRRGTGKTHTLKYLLGSAKVWLPLYVDLRQIGSNRSIYTDAGVPYEGRATTLLVDFLNAVHERLIEVVLAHDEKFDLSTFGPLLDDLSTSISATRVVGKIRKEVEEQQSQQTQDSAKLGLKLAAKPELNLSADAASNKVSAVRTNTLLEGDLERYVVFGDVAGALTALAKAAAPSKFVLLIDEWSDVPLELQPYLADLLRKTMIASGFVLKIAAIEQKCKFAEVAEKGQYVGLQLGADVMADINLDDFMVFDLDESKSVDFFKELLYRHYVSAVTADGDKPEATDSDRFILEVFTEKRAFEEFVRAVEGVPRDALNLLMKAASRAADSRISVDTVRLAARDWYRSDKFAFVEHNETISALLDWIIDQVIRGRKARAFLFPSNRRDPLIETLFDARLLHILKKNISSKEGGERYDVYKLDYGCYVDLLSTGERPTVLVLDGGEIVGEVIEVPQDDYRAIRRATFDIDEFRKAQAAKA